MFGAVIIDPPHLPPVGHEFLIVQSELYLGPQGQAGDYAKMLRGQPDAVDFNGYVNQDVTGALLTAGGIAALVYAVIEAPVNGWGDPVTLGNIVAGLLVLAGFVAFELRSGHPLLDPRLFANRRFAADSLSITLQFFALFGFLFVVMQYLQLVRRDSALMAALSLLAMPIGMVPSSRLSPRPTQRFGGREKPGRAT